ncbi:MAG: GTP-binding protein [Promethearchaeota archaeon]
MDFHANIVILGDTEVGKTALTKRYIGKKFQEKYFMTLGIDFMMINVNFAGENGKFRVWDLGGHQYFEEIRKSYYKGMMGGIIVYDVTRPESLLNIKVWIREIHDSIRFRPFPLIILGNKVDLRREGKTHLREEQGLELVAQLRRELGDALAIEFLETSAKTGFNVSTAFKLLAGMLFYQWRNDSTSFQWLSLSLLRRAVEQHLDLESLRPRDNNFCPYCGSFNLIAACEELMEQKHLFCPTCVNIIQ